MNADSGSVVFDVSKCSMGVPLLVCASHTAAIVRIGVTTCVSVWV